MYNSKLKLSLSCFKFNFPCILFQKSQILIWTSAALPCFKERYQVFLGALGTPAWAKGSISAWNLSTQSPHSCLPAGDNILESLMYLWTTQMLFWFSLHWRFFWLIPRMRKCKSICVSPFQLHQGSHCQLWLCLLCDPQLLLFSDYQDVPLKFSHF